MDVAVESSVYYQATLFFDKRNISQIISFLRQQCTHWFTYMSPKFAPQKVASIVKLFVIPIWRHMTTRAVDSLHFRTRNLHPLNENLSGAWAKEATFC